MGLKTNKIRSRLKVAAALAVCLLGGGFLVLKVQTFGLENGQLGAGNFSGENLAHSLDIQLASQAQYPSAPLSVVKNLGISGGLKETIDSFSVGVDHLTEYALVIQPVKAPPGGYPAIILCHGYINPAHYITTDGYLSDMRFYAGHGFFVIKPDFRGQGLSAKQGHPDSAYYSMAYNIDAMSLISALKQTSYINKSNLNLWGHSMGAYIALRASVTSKDIKNTILLSVPGGSLSEIYLTYVPPSDENNFYALKTRADVFAKYGTPAENTAFWKDASPQNFLGKTQTAYQVNVGSKDKVVPPILAADLDAAMGKAGVRHQYYVYAGGVHSLSAQRYLIWPRSLTLLQP